MFLRGGLLLNEEPNPNAVALRAVISGYCRSTRHPGESVRCHCTDDGNPRTCASLSQRLAHLHRLQRCGSVVRNEKTGAKAIAGTFLRFAVPAEKGDGEISPS